jgi:AcrR family transcriptional regulator
VPKINAPNIAEHVQRQEQAILDAAATLFAERGVAGTDLADIADAVGLARSSLYRYFPGKDQILQAWFAREMAPVIADSRAILARPDPVEDRLTAWLGLQLDYLREADHELAPRLAQELGAVSPEVQQAIADQHAELYGSLDTLVTEALTASGGRPARDHDVVLALLVGLVRAATQAIAGGADPARVGPELNRAALALLDA